MLKWNIEYEDFEGNKISEDFYFNLTKAELTMISLSGDGQDLEQRLKAMIALRDGEAIVREFNKILKMAYGVKSPDGKRFIKNDQVWEEFTQTNAYSDLVMQVLTDAEKSVQFINGIIPKDILRRVEEQIQNPSSETPATPPRRLEEYTQKELAAMPLEVFRQVAGDDPTKMTKDALVVAMNWATKKL